MKEITRELIENIVTEKIDNLSEYTVEELFESMEGASTAVSEIKDKQSKGQLYIMMTPYIMASRFCRYVIKEVLCELLCDEEMLDKLTDESNEIILDAGQSLTIKKDNQRIEINDDGVMVANEELELNK